MRRIGGAIQWALKALGMSKADDAMSGYATLTRPTGLHVTILELFGFEVKYERRSWSRLHKAF